MKNLDEWLSITELLERKFEDLPKSDKGISKKAEREGWEKRQRTGVKGKTYEYYVGDMPESVQKALGFALSRPNSIEESAGEYKTNKNTIDKIMEAVNSLEKKVKELEEPRDNLPDTLDNAEKRLIRWFRLCNKDRQAMLLSSAEVFAEMTLNEQKGRLAPLTDHK
ncbi:DNA-binding protein [Rodentibacter caecimuris]|uniref:DNA-binding protein n=1 Tax=Rodentibacter caecimuris TaxID=1796644 RepID=UPI0010949AF1|nr:MULTISPECIES: DNA-binding protein [Pasteurellaceae]QIA76044.1 ci repressor-like protein [Rodentibacter heylii]TGY49422.1 ci repressor-like protein [Pasteurella caecimuris]